MIITLSGSSKFKPLFDYYNRFFTRKGHIIFSLGLFSKYECFNLSQQEINILKEVQFKKIDICDILFVINYNGYIGNDTLEEIKYAFNKNKEVFYLENYMNIL